MATEGVILGNKISVKGIKVDHDKIEVIEKLPPPLNVKRVKVSLGMLIFIEDL